MATNDAGTALGRVAVRLRRLLTWLNPRRHATPGSLVFLHQIAAKARYPLECRVRALAFVAPAAGDRALCRVLGRYKMFVDTRDQGLGSHLMLDGYWEMWLTQFIARTVRPGMACIDVGANLGYYAILMADLAGPGGRVVAVEPNPAVADILAANLALNGFAGRARVAAVALGDGSLAEGCLAIPATEPKNAALVTAEAAAGFAGDVVTVPVIAFDALAPELPRIDFVKIDAEGAEADILRGMAAMLRRDRPVLVLEFNAARPYAGHDVLAELAAIYGTIRLLDPWRGLLPVSIGTLMAATDREDVLLVFGSPA